MNEETPPNVGAPDDPARVPVPAHAPRTPRRRAIRIVVAGLTVAGVAVGALWAWIAPPVHAIVAVSRKGERVHDYLGGESQNFFIAPFMLLGFLGVLAVVAAVAVWQWRDHRGPRMAAGLSAGLIGAAAAAAAVGALLVTIRYGTLDFDTVALSSREHSATYVVQAPPVFFSHAPLQIVAALLSPAAAASMIYALLTAGTARDDLGGYPPQTRSAPASAPQDVTAADGGSSGR